MIILVSPHLLFLDHNSLTYRLLRRHNNFLFMNQLLFPISNLRSTVFFLVMHVAIFMFMLSFLFLNLRLFWVVAVAPTTSPETCARNMTAHVKVEFFGELFRGFGGDRDRFHNWFDDRLNDGFRYERFLLRFTRRHQRNTRLHSRTHRPTILTISLNRALDQVPLFEIIRFAY